MKKLLFLLLSSFSITYTNAQSVDSTQHSIPKTWDKLFPGIRFSLGTQKAFYTEFGLSFQKYIYDARHGYAAYTYYAAFEWVPSKDTSIYGVKAGYEWVYNGATGGIEIKYLTNKKENDVMITPKLGFGIGAATLFYGYNISTNKRPFDKIGRHQFSLAVNTNLLFYHLKHKE